jgi:hypothetical protein
MGPISVEGSHCIVDDPADPNFSDGLGVLSSARGEMSFEYSGTDVAGVLDGTFVITGGTDTFAGASGSGTLRGTASAEEERGSLRLRGRIVLP